MTYQDIDERRNSEGPESAEVGIGDVGSKDRCDPNRTRPVVSTPHRRDRVLVQFGCQIDHQI